MTEASARYALPFLQPGQAQKELYHNEALALIDLALVPSVEAMAADDPPLSPDIGQAWIVGATPTGAWSGHAGAIAGWTSGGWRFVVAPEGALAWVAADGVWALRSGGTWTLGDLPASRIRIGGVQVVGARQPAISVPGGGSVIDVEGRAAIAAILTALQTHGLIAS